MFDEPGFPSEPDPEFSALPLETFVYCSRASEGVDDAEVDRLVAFSQRNNASRGITGVLVFGSGVFFQWIEGPPADVQDLITRLHKDSRHHDIVELDRIVEKRERLYPGWEMERVDADDIREVLQDALETTRDENSAATLKRILDHLGSAPLASLGRG
jgi:hypothetical protein